MVATASDLEALLRGGSGPAWNIATKPDKETIDIVGLKATDLRLKGYKFFDNISFKDCDFSGAVFQDCELWNAYRNCNFSKVRFPRTYMSTSHGDAFADCCFEQADFLDARIYGSTQLDPANSRNILMRPMPLIDDVERQIIAEDMWEQRYAVAVYLASRSNGMVVCMIGCTRMQPHKFFARRVTTKQMFRKNDYMSRVYPPNTLVPLVAEMLEAAVAINRNDPTQFCGAQAELQRVEETIFQLIPPQHELYRRFKTPNPLSGLATPAL